MYKKNNSSLGKSNEDFVEFDYTDKHRAKDKYVSKRKAKKILRKAGAKKATEDSGAKISSPKPNQPRKIPTNRNQPDFKSLPDDNPWEESLGTLVGEATNSVDDPTTQNVGNPSGTGPGPMRLTPGVDTGMSPFSGKSSVKTILNNPTKSSIRPKFEIPNDSEYDQDDSEYEQSYP
jgi:hypothetical protein